MRHSGTKGNALTEYVLPLALLAGVFAIITLVLTPSLISQLPSTFQATSPSPQNHSLTLKAMGGNPYLSPVEITLSDGSKLRLENYPKNLVGSVETLGADGTTDHLSANLLSLAQQLLEQNKITQEQYNRFADLSNAGHRIAEAERTLEEAMSRAPTKKSPTATGQYDSTMLETLKLGASLTQSDSPQFSETRQPIPTDLIPYLKAIIPDTMNSPETQSRISDLRIGIQFLEFAEFYRSLDQSGAMAEPVVRDTVTQLSRQIILVSDQFEYAFSLQPDQYTMDAFHQTLREQLSVRSTHENSGSICEIGGGKDTGVHCPS